MNYQIHIYAVLWFICTLHNFVFVEPVSLKKHVRREYSTSSDENTDVSVKINGLTAILDNGLIKLTFESNATVSSLYRDDHNLVKNLGPYYSFYLDWHNGTFNQLSPNSLHVISKSADRVHIMYAQDSPGFIRLEYHLIIQKGLCGIYTYVQASNNCEESRHFAELRVIYRFDPELMPQITNGVQEGSTPSKREFKKAKKVQDATWKLANGTYYTKYDYAGYIRNSPYMGVFGNGYGAWLLSASRDYHSGGPLKQDIMVHEASLIANYMTGSHFGTPDLKAPAGWSKIYGPWLLYFNEGTDDEMKKDALHQAKVEQSLWPYQWMNEPDYPLSRVQLKGKVISPVRSMVVLSSSLEEDFDRQTLGFSYSTETDVNGDFQLKNVRPGTYKLTAYPIEGFGIGFQSEKLITLAEGENRVSLDLSVPTKVKWSIGETNRRSDSYRYSNESRNYLWHILPPADLEFQIGKSDIHSDWYYAQTKPGTWSIRYKDSPNGKSRILRIGIAAASNIAPASPNDPGFPIITLSLNDQLITEFQYENDHSIYRSAPQSGNYHAETVIIPNDRVTEGDNVICLRLYQGAVMYDSINLSDLSDDREAISINKVI